MGFWVNAVDVSDDNNIIWTNGLQILLGSSFWLPPSEPTHTRGDCVKLDIQGSNDFGLAMHSCSDHLNQLCKS